MNYLDDGMVLIEGKLWLPAEVTRLCGRVFDKCDGRAPRSAIKRYQRAYPVADATTPTFAMFKKLGDPKWEST